MPLLLTRVLISRGGHCLTGLHHDGRFGLPEVYAAAFACITMADS
eukprot:SAG31_NODE_17265_length_677_cov_1.242215_3_plen_44_part_01